MAKQETLQIKIPEAETPRAKTPEIPETPRVTQEVEAVIKEIRHPLSGFNGFDLTPVHRLEKGGGKFFYNGSNIGRVDGVKYW